MRNGTLQSTTALLALVACAGLPVVAHAQGQGSSARSGAEQRRDLLGRALAAQNAGHHDEALDYVTRAGEIAMNSSVRRFQAQELEALGRLGEALDRARECLALGADEPQSGPRDQVLSDCRARASGLEPRVARVLLHLPASPPAGTEVRVGGVVVPEARWATAVPVTPGHVAVEITAPGMQAFHQDVEPAAGAQVEVPVTLAAAPADDTHQAAPPAAHPATAMHTVRSPVGPAVAVVGVLGLVAAGVLRVVANGQYDGLRNACTTGTSPCDSRANADAARNGINTLDTAGAVAAVAGGVLVVGGAAMFFALTHQEAEAPPRAGRVRVLPGLASVSVDVTF